MIEAINQFLGLRKRRYISGFQLKTSVHIMSAAYSIRDTVW